MFEVDTNSLMHNAQGIDDIATVLNGLESRLRAIEVNNAIAGKSYRSVMASVARASQLYSKRIRSVRNMAQATRSVAKTYAEAEQGIISSGRSLLGKGVATQTHGAGAKDDIPPSQRGQNSHNTTGVSSDGRVISKNHEQLITLFKSIIGLLNKDSNGNQTDNGLYAGLISYLMAFVKVFDAEGWKGSGYQELTKYAKESISFLKTLYKAVGEKGVSTELGVVSTFTGLYSTLIGWLEGNYSSRADFISAWGDNAISLFSVTNPSITASACVGGIWGFARSLGKTYEKYYAPNGKLDPWEVETAINMVFLSTGFGVVESASKGVISQKTLGVTYEEAAEERYRNRPDGAARELIERQRLWEKRQKGTITEDESQRLNELDNNALEDIEMIRKIRSSINNAE